MASLKGAPSQSSTVLPSAGSFYVLSDGAHNLDRMLFIVLCTLVIGSKSVLLDCTQDQSYIRGMCLLYKHCDISRNGRIHNAFNGMDSFRFKTSAQKWLSRPSRRSKNYLTHVLPYCIIVSLESCTILMESTRLCSKRSLRISARCQQMMLSTSMI